MTSEPSQPEDLDALVGAYSNDPFERENALTIAGYVAKCVRHGTDRSRYLELGIGHGVALGRLAASFETVTVLEGAVSLVRRYEGQYPNVRLVHSFFEDYLDEGGWPNIGMGFVLEHVDDPEALLRHCGRLLAPAGSLFVGVPNAASLHRLIGNRMGLLPDVHTMSDQDRAFGHKRFLDFQQWVALFERAGFVVKRSEGLYLKPFTTTQLALLQLPEAAHLALLDLSADHPTISNSCFFHLALAS